MNGFKANDVMFAAASDVVVVGQDGEFADYDNPQGYIYGLAHYVVASNTFGDTKVTGAKDEDAAVRLAAALTARAASGRLPVGFDSWRSGRAVYGSDAYVAYGQDDDLACERNEG